jgi:hypothetical protein
VGWGSGYGIMTDFILKNVIVHLSAMVFYDRIYRINRIIVTGKGEIHANGRKWNSPNLSSLFLPNHTYHLIQPSLC